MSVTPTAPPAANERPVAPHGLGWALLALALGGVGIGTGEFVPMGLLPDVADGIDRSITTSGHVISAYALGVVVGAPIIAALGANLPRRRLLVTLMAVYLVGNLLSAAAPTYASLVAARFITGLPHGAFFGVASLAAAALVPPQRRAWAITRVMLGLSVANVAIVPAATAIGQAVGWRSVFVLVAALAGLTIAAILQFVPATPGQTGSAMRRELRALKNPQVLLTLAIGAIGFGGLFAVYAYISPTLTERAGIAESTVPLYLLLLGLGMVSGGLIGGHVIDRALKRTLVWGLTAFAITFALFTVASQHAVAAAVGVFLIGHVMLIGAALQSRLMDVAGDAQTLAATMNHASVNMANALGPGLAGLAITSSGSWAAPAWVGAAMALGGLVLLLISLWLERRTAASEPSPLGPPSEAAEQPAAERALSSA